MPSTRGRASFELTSEQVGGEVRGEVTAREGERVVGRLRFADYANYKGGRSCQINWIEVAPDARGKGIATRMVAELRRALPKSRPAQFFVNEEGRALSDAIYDDYAEPVEEPG